MKTTFSIAALLLSFTALCCGPADVSAQATVPKGWESHDSVRFGLFYINPGSAALHPQIDSVCDTLGVNFEEEWGPIGSSAPYVGFRRGFAAPVNVSTPDSINIDLTHLGNVVQQRIYYASPERIPLAFGDGYWWRYNDVNIASAHSTWHNNTYDANDISPYSEFPSNDTIVNSTFHTRRFVVGGTIVDSVVRYGNEGRVVLGFSDNRLADQLLRTSQTYSFGADTGTNTPKAFSATLDFNVDESAIDTANAYVTKDHVPLIRLQILFKQSVLVGSVKKHVLPFVPFETPATMTNSNYGWYALVDTTITKAIYDSLPPCWRTEDVLNGNSSTPSHPWQFKQLHVMLKNLPSAALSLVQATPDGSIRGDYGAGTNNSGIITSQHPDSLVAYGIASFAIDTESTVSAQNLIELRVLSTYRDTVRIRSLEWQDTTVDKFLYRKRIAGVPDSTHSCNPNGSIGGYDDLMATSLATWARQLGPRRPREILYNDTWAPFGPLSGSAISYIEYMASKQGIYTHIREQEIIGEWTRQLRREGLSYDGNPPSMFENQENVFVSNNFNYWKDNPQNLWRPMDVFPQDYLFNGLGLSSAVYSTPWLHSVKDSMMGLIIERSDRSGGDSLVAYKRYSVINDGCRDFFWMLRQSVNAALRHPLNKRFAIESDIQGWGLMYYKATNGYRNLLPGAFDPHYNQRPTTPEETSAMMFGLLANGIATFNNAQPFDFAPQDSNVGIDAGLFCPKSTYHYTGDMPQVHDYNFGHNRNAYAFSDGQQEADLAPSSYYLGYSTTYRSFLRTLQRINLIYGSGNGNKYPVKRFQWQDAYSMQRAYQPFSRLTNTVDSANGVTLAMDSVSLANAFLKIVKTVPVNPWTRDAQGSYLDLTTADSLQSTYVEVGLFRDSVTSSLVNHGAMIVNVRLQPSLRDSVDINYYNAGLATKDQARSTLGDIDVRKIYMKIDNSQLPAGFKSDYYVVRDLWHPDTTWLVKADSQFAVYIKPGDAKFLYFEKAYSILVSKTGATGTQEFCFNNGRRVAERKRGSQTVTCYTRGHKLYVSYAARGSYFGGASEHSDHDNIATGNEEALDTSRYCARPSIIVGANDSSVAMAYFVKVSNDSGYIRVAYQNGPGATWKFANFTGESFADSSSDLSQVTPVITQGNNSNFVVLAANRAGHSAPFQISAFRFKYESDSALHLQSHSTPLYVDGIKECLFPTVASRPLDSTFWPIRYAWQRDHHIYYAQARDTVLSDGNIASVNLEVNPLYVKPRRLDKYLPGCYSLHPSIAMNGTHQFGLVAAPYASGTVTMTVVVSPVVGFGGVPFITTITIPATNPSTWGQEYFADDYVVWESQLMDTGIYNTGANYWPVSTGSHTPFSYAHGIRIPGKQFWGGYNIFPLRTTDPTFHYPIISAEKRYWDKNFIYDSAHGVQYHDWIRMAWQNHTINGSSKDSLETVHWIPNWRKTLLFDLGKYPSLGQSTDSLEHWTDSSTVPASVVFQDLNANGDGNFPVRITNGLFPLIGTKPGILPKPGYAIFKSDTSNNNCPGVLATIGVGTGRLLGTSSVPIVWIPADITLPGFEDASWPRNPMVVNPIRSTQFTYHSDDQILIPRNVDTIDLPTIQSQLASDSDYVIFWVALWKAKDSTFIRSLDTFLITKHSTDFSPGTLSTGSIMYMFPHGTATDSAYVTMALLRGDTTNGLQRSYLERVQLDTNAPSYKQTGRPVVSANAKLRFRIHPNPFNPTTWIELTSVPSMPLTVELYDMLGRRVQILFDGESPNGELHLVLDASGLSSGSYMVRATSGGEIVTHRIELVK